MCFLHCLPTARRKGCTRRVHRSGETGQVRKPSGADFPRQLAMRSAPTPREAAGPVARGRPQRTQSGVLDATARRHFVLRFPTRGGNHERLTRLSATTTRPNTAGVSDAVPLAWVSSRLLPLAWVWGWRTRDGPWHVLNPLVVPSHGRRCADCPIVLWPIGRPILIMAQSTHLEIA